MKIEGLEVKEASERKKESGDGKKVVTTYFLVLKNDDGDRVSITTTGKVLREFLCSYDVDLELTSPQKVLRC